MKITIASHILGAFETGARSQCYSIDPSLRFQNHTKICDLSVNIYYGTGSK